MFLIAGTRACGKVDEVPGLFHVTTRFVHLYYVPLIPVGSFLLQPADERHGRPGEPLGLNAKSIAFAYLRTGLAFATAVCGFAAVAQLGLDWGNVAAAGLAAAGCAAAWRYSYWLSRPGVRRALRWADRLGLEPETVARYFYRAGLPAEVPAGPDETHDTYHTEQPHHG
jgi:hypothetical protein